jgi:plastocyanin
MDSTGATQGTQDRAIYSVILGFVILAIILGGIFYLVSQNAQETDDTPQVTVTVSPTPRISPSPIVTPPADTTPEENPPAQESIEIDVVGSNFSFSPDQIVVSAGTRVVINFSSGDDMEHDFTIDELNVATSQLEPGQSETIEFVVTEPGTYTYYCSVGDHRAFGMEGTLVVE